MFRSAPAARPHLTICGISELCSYQSSSVSHVLSILDPQYPDPEDFSAYTPHRRLTLRFHDIIEPQPGQVMPAGEHIDELLRFGKDLAAEDSDPLSHLLVHCHMGISRSTAALVTLLAQAQPDEDAEAIFTEIVSIRPQAWPNSVMVGLADERLGRGGSLTAALRRHYGRQIAARPELAEMIGRVGRDREVRMAV